MSIITHLLRPLRSMPDGYSHTNITICWSNCDDLWLFGGTTRHLNALKVFRTDKGLSINMNKTLVVAFNTIQAWGNKIRTRIFLGLEKVAYTHTYTYLGVTFIGPRLSLWEVVCAWLSHGYAALDTLERHCAHLQFQEPRTKSWLFDTLVTLTLLYGVEMWGQVLTRKITWKI